MRYNGPPTKFFGPNWSLFGGTAEKIQIPPLLCSNFFLTAPSHRYQFGPKIFIERSFCPIFKMENQTWISKKVEGLFEKFALEKKVPMVLELLTTEGLNPPTIMRKFLVPNLLKVQVLTFFVNFNNYEWQWTSSGTNTMHEKIVRTF